MSKQTINIGASPNDGTGTPLRTSFDYTNQNFTELYTALGGGVGLPGATTQVIFNDGGTNLAGDAGLVYNKTTDTLTAGNATITGDLTVDTSTLKVDSANNRVGIGTASPANTLEVVAPAGDNIVSTFRSGDATAANNAGGGFRSISSATAASRVAQVWLDADGANFSGGDYFFIQKNGSSGTVEFHQSSNAAMTFLTNSTERMRIDSSGNLGIGVTPSAWSNPYKCVQLSGGSLSVYPTTDLYISQNAYNSGGWKRVAAGYASQYIQTNSEHRFLIAVTDPTVDSAIAFTQAMTLDASGNLLVGTTAVGMTAGGVRLKNGGGNLGEISLSNNSGAADYVARFVWGSGATLVGNITVSSGGTSFVTTSDYRLKESVVPLSGGLARVNALKPSTYKWKADGSNGEGFIAHELAEVVPLAVTGVKDAVNEDGTVNPQGVDLSKVVPVLVAAIQELTARVQTLEAK